jgi:sulfite exporter TauE/SafE
MGNRRHAYDPDGAAAPAGIQAADKEHLQFLQSADVLYHYGCIPTRALVWCNHRWEGGPMLLIVLTYIALYQTAFQGFFTMLIYAVGLSIPFIVISSLGGALGKKIKDQARVSSEVFDKIIGIVIVLIGIYFLYPAFQ